MIKMLLLLLLVPTSTLALIKIGVIGTINGNSDSDLVANLLGRNSDLITFTERSEYGLTDGAIKDAIKQSFGQSPDNVYVRSPTPWGDLYKTYGWTQVVRTTQPVNARLAYFSISDSMVRKEEVFENNSTKNLDVDVALYETVQNTVTSSWSNGGHETSEELRVKYDLNVHGNDVVRGYRFTWRKKGKGKIESTLGSKSAVKMVLEPGQSAIVKLEARKVVLTLEVYYESTLSGAVACNFEEVYKGHHFFNFEVDEILTVKSLPKKRKVTQTLEYMFYIDDRLVVNDKKGSKLMTKKFSTNSSSGDKERTRLKSTGIPGSGKKSSAGVGDELNPSSDGDDSEENEIGEEVAQIHLSLPKYNSTNF